MVVLLTASPDSMQPVEALLEVAAYPDQAISSISFNFWHRLMRQLTSGFSGPEAAPGANQEGLANAHNAVSLRHNHLFVFFLRLVVVMVLIVSSCGHGSAHNAVSFRYNLIFMFFVLF